MKVPVDWRYACDDDRVVICKGDGTSTFVSTLQIGNFSGLGDCAFVHVPGPLRPEYDAAELVVAKRVKGVGLTKVENIVVFWSE